MNKPKYKYNEAFCLMQYQGQVSKRFVTIWNSRDGVTPFMAEIDGEMFQHVNWHLDLCIPDRKLRSGDWFFRDTTPEDAQKVATEIVDKHSPNLKGKERDKLIAELAPGMLAHSTGERHPWLDRVTLIDRKQDWHG